LLILTCGLACNRRRSPQVAFDHAHQTFLHGDLKQSQEEAHRECQRFRDSNPEWAWKFRILEAESLMLRGMSQDALTLLNSQPTPPAARDALIEMLAIEGVAYAREHSFPEAARSLGQAEQLCSAVVESICGNVSRAQGVFAIERGQLALARRFFENSLSFARAHGDQFLEATALLNLGASSLREEHFGQAIDWTEAALQSATAIDAGSIATKALGNLGWAYYNLGDTEKSLQLTEQAEKRSIELANVIDQLSYLNNAGYLYAELRDTPRAEQSYLSALGLARKIDSKEDIYNSLRALALVSVESGDPAEARKYSDEAIAIARVDNNRLDELYPLLVKGMVAARSHDGAEADRIFHEVEVDPNANTSLKWRAEHALARLYEDEGRSDAADREYRAALATFETARSSLQRNDAKLPFSNNASRIYDDYVCFLVAHGRTADALRWADYSRARTLAEGLGLLAKGASTGPPPLHPQQIARRAEATVLFYWLGEKQSYLWAITPQKTGLFKLPAGSEIDAAVRRYRKALGGPQDILESADPDGRWLYGVLVAPAQALLNKDAKVFVIPDGSLNNLNFETLLVPEPESSEAKLHYWIEDVTIANASSLRVLGAARASGSKEKRDRSLLLFGNSVAPNDKYPELPKAAAQMESVARHFPVAEQRIFAREQATPAAYLASSPEQFSYIHFVAHGTASRLSPLDSAIVLSKVALSKMAPSESLSKNGSLKTGPSMTVPFEGSAENDSFKLYARDIIGHPLRAELVTISACYGAGERAYSGEGLVGLSWAFLRAGAHHVVAALWEATDASTEQLMDKFYDELDKGARPDAALRAAKLSLLRGSGFHNPFYWAPFQLYAGS
jgi:CHAT domain-containing protein